MLARLEDVHVRIDGARILNGLDLDLAAGDFVGLLGPNGAGKTTLLRVLSGVLPPSSGRVTVDGRPVASLSPRELARIVAVVPQETAATFPFLVEEVVLMGRSPHLGRLEFEGRRDHEIAACAMRETETSEFANREIGSLSGGERQRVYIARALAQEPRLLLLDEPTSFLDLRHRVGLFRLLERLNEERGLTVLTVSHDLNLAARHCRRLALVRAGAVVEQGAPTDVLTTRTLRDVFGVDARVRTDSGAPFVLPTEREPEPPEEEAP
jgi:iron complex transport system ATP-binding protein